MTVAFGLCEMLFYSVLANSGWNLDPSNPQRPESDKFYAGCRAVFKFGNNTSVSKFSLISTVSVGVRWDGGVWVGGGREIGCERSSYLNQVGGIPDL